MSKTWQILEDGKEVWSREGGIIWLPSLTEDGFKTQPSVLHEFMTNPDKEYTIKKGGCTLAVLHVTDCRHSNHIAIMADGGYSIYPKPTI